MRLLPRRRALVALALGLLLALPLAELAARLAARGGGAPYDAAAAAEELRLLASPLTLAPWTGEQGDVDVDEVMLTPYTGGMLPGNSRELSQYLLTGPPEDDLFVLVLGGSVAGHFSAAGRPRLKELLEASPDAAGRRVKILGYAHPAYKQPSTTIRLLWLLLHGYRPDAVVLIDGYNEVVHAAHNGGAGTYPLYPHPSLWRNELERRGGGGREALELHGRIALLRAEALELAESWEARGWLASAVLGRVALARGRSLAASRNALQEELLALEADPDSEFERERLGPPFDRKHTLDLAVEAWTQGSHALHDLCRTRGIAYVHVLQPSRLLSGSKPMSVAEDALPTPFPHYRTAVELGYPLLIERAEGLRAAGVHFVDATDLFADVRDTRYKDEVHFTDVGQRELAERFAPALVEALAGE